jgi:hypothetical protein
MPPPPVLELENRARANCPKRLLDFKPMALWMQRVFYLL